MRDKEVWEREWVVKLLEGEKVEGEVEEVLVFFEKRVWEGGVEEVYEYLEKRVLMRKYFEKGLREISVSILEDMDSLKVIRKFDE